MFFLLRGPSSPLRVGTYSVTVRMKAVGLDYPESFPQQYEHALSYTTPRVRVCHICFMTRDDRTHVRWQGSERMHLKTCGNRVFFFALSWGVEVMRAGIAVNFECDDPCSTFVLLGWFRVQPT